MIAFPNLPLPALPLEEEWEDPGMRSDMADGSTIGRARFTRKRLKSVVLNWQTIPLSAEEYETLVDWLDAIKGSATNFCWIHPVSHREYTMRVVTIGKFKWGENDEPGWSGSLTIGEA